MSPIVVTGTDTGVGKTVFAAGLTAALGARYWKPVQSGLDEGGDTSEVARLAGLPPERIAPEAWRLRTPVSPHLAAEIDGVEIDPEALEPPVSDGPLVIEGAGGLLVPLNRRTLTIDLFARWGLPVVLVARTGLGTINHTLLSLEALAGRRVPVLGVAFVGEANDDNAATIAAFSGVKVLGRLPRLDPLTPETLAAAFAASFHIADFRL
ncbi:ATP-dependent dethiobiotin synthetase BioD [Methylopila jiangsuensis]|uniref:ATP-dependent dethiobiotin synthetase BioD n=1 Tax=Methylopila jiangsuensis TaxID=586230 RepID=A0A9W6N5G8_9HYPH|nr:dethiobiotin synthase [Methylopila jiangsuensis]MDR6284394.1 dethiobiotin synthetase [Methylopila jiangsuensis]GLK78221.1 ATP-dependent dethiobiotin synthetase BioD [Methylopila jiangsuensis]